ncbi:MarR family winged helix-turn-helix transcriptional regulator [Portibacter lacus]|uniref:HTH marR-type domain-containing protein n=1 Tax=Portibacter lacus TaxID=1099794 RepID=A0AA37WF00_9BACT|nr:MarR family transcriptional regulator [Portibacter lacus]GLR17294.1 hypothetical protein GCM10007940_19090 [Portibacter lacus]
MQDKDLSSVFLFKIENTAKQFRKYKNRIFKEKGIDITSDQWILLKNINEEEGINQTELAIRSKKEAAAVTRTLDILERKKMIVRKANPNSRRVYNLMTSAQGKKVIEQILPIALEIRKQAKLDIPDEDVEVLNQLLDKIFDNLK